MDADVFRSGVHDMKKLDHRTHYVSASFMSRMVADYSEFRPYGGYYVYIYVAIVGAAAFIDLRI